MVACTPGSCTKECGPVASDTRKDQGHTYRIVRKCRKPCRAYPIFSKTGVGKLAGTGG